MTIHMIYFHYPMNIFPFPQKTKTAILALGAESDGNFCFFAQNKIHFSESFGDLLDEKNWTTYQKAVLDYLKKNKLKPKIILTDLHPHYLTTIWGEELAKKYKARHVQVQHHIAHIFSAIGDYMINYGTCPVKRDSVFYGVAADGTGYGADEKIWGGEIFELKKQETRKRQREKGNLIIERIGQLENQILIGGDLAVKEPARMLISILDKVFSAPSSPLGRGCHEHVTGEGKGELKRKDHIYSFIKKYYTKNEFELIYSQLKQNFNCLETSSTGRVLDATSLLLGFCKNEREHKHAPIGLLEINSTKPYTNIKPEIIFDEKEKKYILQTTPLFQYLIKNTHRDKKRLAATTQLYVASGLYEIIKQASRIPNTRYQIPDTFFAGGIANNKIISSYLESKNIHANKKIPRGDAGLSFGQVVYFLLNRN